MKKQIAKLVSKVARATAEKTANSTCEWWLYQEKPPMKLKQK